MVETTFNLPPPPYFRGLHPDRPITVYHRHLPHWRQEGATYYVTFRLGDALPQSMQQFLRRLRAEWEQTHPEPKQGDWERLVREYVGRVERCLDEGYGVCHFRQQRWVHELRDRLMHFQDDRYFVSCWSIMPNHCHVVIRPQNHDLERIVGAVKGVVSRHINSALGTCGSLWQEESYDRIIRDEEHLWRVIQYIGNNPRLAGLQHEQSWRRWLHPLWEHAGWRFADEA